MAWQAKIEDARRLPGGRFAADVLFWDDEAPDRQIREPFIFENGTTKAQAKDLIVARGQALRTASQADSAVKTLVGAGVSFPIP